MKTEFLNGKNEKGAALVTVLLMMALLLTGCIALLAGASLLTANVTDAVAEQQAYNAAESGIQTAINVLRRNNAPSPLMDSTQPTNHSNNKIDYARAVNLETSNAPDDPSTDARLSRWINYNCTSPGATAPDRASIGNEGCDSTSLSAFSVTVRDPDNPTSIIALTTSASIDGGGSSKPFYGLGNFTTIEYSSASTGNVNITTREANASLGTFIIRRYGVGSGTPITDTPFTITVKMTAPLPAVVKLRGTIKAGTAGAITGNSVGTVKIVFDSPVYSLLGSIITLPVGEITPNAPNVNSGKTDLGVTITLSQPRRLVIRSVGYGPRGARKVFEAIVKRDNFDGLIPATVTLVGSVTGSLFKSSTPSIPNEIIYSGNESASNAKIPPIATIGGSGGGGLLTGLLGSLTSGLCANCTINGNPADISTEETPDFLKSAANLDASINEYREIAKASGRYFTNANPPTDSDFGNNFNGTGITFVDGDTVLSGAGGGILIVTGKLTLGGAFNFKGTILATGADGVRKTGGGNSSLNGNLVVAPYQVGNTAAGFLPPKYDITGGTVGKIVYNASNLLFGSDNFNTVVVSVGEK